MRRWLPWALLAVVLAVALVLGTRSSGGTPSQAERVDRITRTLRCPTCRGQSVHDSDAPAAENIRKDVTRQVAEGRTDDDIKASLVDRFGEDILLTPPRSGIAGLVWVLPVAALIAAIAGLAVAFRRWRAVDVAVSDDDRVLVERARRRT